MAIIWAGSAWLLGLVLAALKPLLTVQWLILACTSGGCAYIFRRHRSFRSIFILICILCLGSSRRASAQITLNQDLVAYYADIGYEVQVTGNISEDPETLETYTRLTLKADRIWIPPLGIQKQISGKILVIASPFQDFEFGQRLKVSGLLETPPEDGDFSYREYLAREGILAWMPDGYARSLGMGAVPFPARLLHQARQKAFVEIQQLFPYPEAPLIAGILLGIESHIPADLLRAYSATGTTHIIAISGFNITILAGLVVAVFSRSLGKTRGMIAAVIVIIVYTFFVGADPPVVRAAIMGTLALVARFLGRRTHGLASLTTAAVVMTSISPRALEDVGFQLSFAATLGLILYAEPLNRVAISILGRVLPGIDAARWGSVLGELLLFTLAAQITTLPLIAFHFHQLSLISLITNALILPLQPLLMIISGIAVILGMIWHPVGMLLALLAWPFSALSNQVVRLLATTPGGVLYIGSLGASALLGYYGLLFSLTLTSWKLKLPEFLRLRVNFRRGMAKSAVLLTLALTALVVWHALQRQPDGLLNVIVLNVGEGDSILIRTPGGEALLINGGSSPVQLATQLGLHLPYPDREIDWLLIAGTRYDQLAGLRDIVSMTSVGQVLISATSGGSAFQTLHKELVGAERPIHYTQVGIRLDLGDGAGLEVLTQGPYGATYLLEYGDARILLPLGLSPAEIPQLIEGERSGHLTAVCLADGGNPAVNPPNLIQHLDPQFFINSCAAGECQPEISTSRQVTVERTLRTDIHGSISLFTDGKALWITTEHAPTTP